MVNIVKDKVRNISAAAEIVTGDQSVAIAYRLSMPLVLPYSFLLSFENIIYICPILKAEKLSLLNFQTTIPSKLLN